MVKDKELRKELNKLQRDLKGKYSEIAREMNVSITTVSRVLNGDFENNDILRACVAKRKKIIAERELLKKINTP